MTNEQPGVRVEHRHGIETHILENDFLRAEILTGKGGDLYALTYKPTGIDVLLKVPGALAAYEGRDLAKDPLKWYSELFTGGWVDVLPGFALWGDNWITQENSGVAATLPWKCAEVSQNGGRSAVRLSVELSTVPMAAEKTFSLEAGSRLLHIAETVRNTGEVPMRFTWVQHAAFAGVFVDGAEIGLPARRVFTGREYARESGRFPLEWEFPVTAMPLGDGSLHDMTKPLPADARTSFVAALRELSETAYTLRNQALDMSVRVEWDRRMFPYLRCWYASGKNGRSVALEPATHFAGNREDAFHFGSYATLEPGQSADTWLSCEIY